VRRVAVTVVVFVLLGAVVNVGVAWGGGIDDLRNLAIACSAHNSARGDATFEKFMLSGPQARSHDQ
jgi:hypothetical protein